MKLTRDTLAQIAFKSVEVKVEDWGGVDVRLRELTVGNFQKYQEYLRGRGEEGEDVEAAVKALQMSICDDSGKLLFDDDEGAKALNDQGVSGLLFLAREVLKLNRMVSVEAEVEEATENFN